MSIILTYENQQNVASGTTRVTRGKVTGGGALQTIFSASDD